jgi:hypothetical protein
VLEAQRVKELMEIGKFILVVVSRAEEACEYNPFVRMLAVQCRSVIRSSVCFPPT